MKVYLFGGDGFLGREIQKILDVPFEVIGRNNYPSSPLPAKSVVVNLIRPDNPLDAFMSSSKIKSYGVSVLNVSSNVVYGFVFDSYMVSKIVQEMFFRWNVRIPSLSGSGNMVVDVWKSAETAIVYRPDAFLDYLPVETAAYEIVEILLHRAPGMYVVGSGLARTQLEIACSCNQNVSIQKRYIGLCYNQAYLRYFKHVCWYKIMKHKERNNG